MMTISTNGSELPLSDRGANARWRREADEAQREREELRAEAQERADRERAEQAATQDWQAAARDWDAHFRGLIDEHWECMAREAVGNAIGLSINKLRREIAVAIRTAVLEAFPEVSRQRELAARQTDEAIERLRGEMRAETRTNLRLMLLEQGFMPRVRGTWSEKDSYSALDIVMSDGTCWIAKYSNPGPLPGEGWQILSCKGERGKQGPQGPRGETGPQGPPGEMGARGAPGLGVVRWEVDREQFLATPIMTSGQPGPSIQLRELFEEFQRQTSS